MSEYLTKSKFISSGILHEIDIYFANYCEDLEDERVWLLAALVSNRCNNQHSAVNPDLVSGIELGQLSADVNDEFGKLKFPNLAGIEKSSRIGCGDDFCPLILENGLFYMNRYRRYENIFCNFIKSKNRNFEINSFLHGYLNELFPENEVGNQANWQKVAAMVALKYDFAIISGGPGTGKTTTVAKVLALLQLGEKKFRIQLLAPTGKAADRLNESVKNFKLENSESKIAEIFAEIPENCMTIHRFLNICKRHNYDNGGSPYDLILIDEASMVSLELFSMLVAVLSKECRVILLGDKDQLASVENGSVLNDLSKLQPINTFSKDFIKLLSPMKLEETFSNSALLNKVVQLRHSYRFKSEQGIGTLSRFVNDLKQDDIAVEESLERIISESSEVQWSELPLDKLLKSIARDMIGFKQAVMSRNLEESFVQLGKIRVLCALNRGIYGVHEVNAFLAQALYGPQAKSYGFYHGQPIIITKNDYNLKLMNGDVGIVFCNELGELEACFRVGNGFIKINPTALGEYEVAFALTIHKSQGSEFDKVFLVLPESDNKIISKELIYTGITRAKKQCTIFAKRDLFIAGCKRKIERESGLVRRLQ
ncbi:MAG: exodeoxyribonuclease V subunit alpha [Lentisphaeria bacterium]